MSKYITQPLLTATFKEVYQSDSKETIDDLLKNSNRDDIISLCSSINSKFNSPDFLKWEFEAVNNIITNLPRAESILLAKRFNQLREQNKQYPRVFNIVSSLKLIQYALSNLSNNNSILHRVPDLIILKVFLILNGEVAEPTDKLIDQYEHLSFKEKYVRSMSAATMVNSEFLTLKEAVVQSLKLKSLFEYLESHNTYKILVSVFLDKYKVSKWNEYLKYIMILYMSFHDDNGKFSEKQVNYKIPLKNYEVLMHDFINSLVINNHISELKDSNDTSKKDFYYLRNFPFYVSKDGFLNLLNVNFLVDHIFQSVYFEFKNLIEKNISKKEADNFKSTYSLEFSQDQLFRKTIEYCFNDNRMIKEPGTSSGNSKDHSDFYIRKDKYIYLFEFKDYLLPMNLKYSMDFEEINKYLEDRFVSKAGIVQILKVIKNIEQGGFEFDRLTGLDNFENGKIIIQPVIVFSDLALSFDGLNNIMNKYFREEISKIAAKFVIKDLIFVPLDLLIKYQDLFHNNQLKLTNLFPSYLSFINRTTVPDNAKVDPEEFMTFEQYFYKRLQMKKIRPGLPIAFKEISKIITNNQKEKL